jgi:hypothetical protein
MLMMVVGVPVSTHWESRLRPGGSVGEATQLSEVPPALEGIWVLIAWLTVKLKGAPAYEMTGFGSTTASERTTELLPNLLVAVMV